MPTEIPGVRARAPGETREIEAVGSEDVAEAGIMRGAIVDAGVTRVIAEKAVHQRVRAVEASLRGRWPGAAGRAGKPEAAYVRWSSRRAAAFTPPRESGFVAEENGFKRVSWAPGEALPPWMRCLSRSGAEGSTPAVAPASQPIAEDVAVAARLDVAAEAVFELRTIERRLLELLVRVRERLDLEHHEGMARNIGGRQRRKLALEAIDRAAFEHALEPHGARDRGI